MKTIYDIIKDSGAEQGVDVMWETTKVISDAIERSMPEDAKEKLYMDLYGHLSKGHYNEQYARESIKKMYHTDKDGKKHFGPFVDEVKAKEAYEDVKAEIPHYCFWDWLVTMNMIVSDNASMLKDWFPEEDLDAKYACMTLNWLKDEDWENHDKIWHYLNA